MSTAPDICPNCGATVPTGARACPECGADEQTGWSEDARYEQLGIPSESFDYQDFVEREFHGKKPKRKRHYLWAIVAIVLIVAFILYFWPH